MAHSTRFNRDWLSKADYKPWLASVEDVTKAYCKMCMKAFSLSNMGEIAVKSHASGKKHQTAVTQSQKASSVSEFFEAKSRTTSGLVSSENLEEPSASLIHDHEVTLQESGSMSTSHGNVMSKFTLTKHQHKVEILWALKTVMSHFSYNSSTNIADVFRAMFPDSAIAQKMNCGPTKLSYLICFGIAPYFKQQLLKELKEPQCYVISFDESLNTELHEEQMDFLVRYFHKDKVTCRYITSGFLGQTRAEDLKMKFEEGIIELEKKKMLQISMDGPNVNWKLYDSIVEKRSENDDYPGLIDIGSCNLHIVHGAFRTGVQKTKWGIDGILQALYNLFPYSPAKREDYQKLTGLKVFPTRWIEDKKVADRAIQIWTNIIKYINETLKKPKSQVPTSSYFAKIRSAVQDSLIVAKLQFFASTASLMVPYLQKFQTDTPLIAFTTTEVTVLLETLMQKFIKQSEMQAANTVVKIAKLNVMDTTIHVAPSDVDVGFAATDTLTKAVNEKKLSSRQVFEFKKECCTMLAAIVSKIQERSPLMYSFARNLVSLDPRLIAAEPDKVVRMFREVLTNTEVKQFHKDKFSGFKFGEDRLDTFFFEVLDQKIAYKGLWCTVKLLLTLSHGQAAVE